MCSFPLGLDLHDANSESTQDATQQHDSNNPGPRHFFFVGLVGDALQNRSVTYCIVTFEGAPFKALFVAWGVLFPYSKSHISKTGLCGAPGSRQSAVGSRQSALC